MLSDTETERYARQVVLPEVGGRGQERLLASRVAVLGDGPASRHAADLLRRAGVAVTDANAATVVDLRPDTAGMPAGAAGALVWGRLRGTTITVLTLPAPARPACVGAPVDVATPPSAGPLVACALHALGALAATETLVMLLAPTRRARRTSFDVTTGAFTATALEASP